MHFDIAEIIRQKQQKQPRTISIENGKQVEISMSNGGVVVRAFNLHPNFRTPGVML